MSKTKILASDSLFEAGVGTIAGSPGAGTALSGGGLIAIPTPEWINPASMILSGTMYDSGNMSVGDLSESGDVDIPFTVIEALAGTSGFTLVFSGTPSGYLPSLRKTHPTAFPVTAYTYPGMKFLDNEEFTNTQGNIDSFYGFPFTASTVAMLKATFQDGIRYQQTGGGSASWLVAIGVLAGAYSAV